MKIVLVKVGSAVLLAVLALGAAGGASADSGRPDDRAVHGPGAIVAQVQTARPDDRPLHGPGSIGSSTPVVVNAIREPGFDWADAGIGAAAVLGLGFLAAGASIVELRRRRGSSARVALP